jgi:hypothetical protein
MKNTEKELKDLNLPPATEKEITYVGIGGKSVAEKDRHFTKCVVSNFGYEEVSHHYYVKVGSGELADPYGVDSSISLSQLNSRFTYRKVNEQTHDAYVKYLTTKNRIHFTTARRLLLSEN